MERRELAASLVAASNPKRAALLAQHAALLDVELARALKDICLEAWTSDPSRAMAASAALAELADIRHEVEVRALADWAAGIAALVDGQMEAAIVALDKAEAQFKAVDDGHAAASTQVSKLIALAILGRYDEAIVTGQQARNVFVAHNDLLAAGKIEQNLGGIHFRQDKYREAEQFYRTARDRFIAVGDQKELAKARSEERR